MAPPGGLSRLNPLEAILLSILIEHQKTLDALQARLAHAATPGATTGRLPPADAEQLS